MALENWMPLVIHSSKAQLRWDPYTLPTWVCNGKELGEMKKVE